MTVLGVVEVWQVIALALVLGAVNAFDMPIRQAMTVEMVGRQDVAAAVALNSALFNGARIIGPAIAGILIGLVGIAACFVINAFTYAAVIAALLVVRPDELAAAPRDIPDRTVRAVLEHLGAGLGYVRRAPVVLAATTVIGIVSIAALNLQVTLPLIAQDLLVGRPRGVRLPRGRERCRLPRQRDRARVRWPYDAGSDPHGGPRDRARDGRARVL